MRPHTA